MFTYENAYCNDKCDHSHQGRFTSSFEVVNGAHSIRGNSIRKYGIVVVLGVWWGYWGMKGEMLEYEVSYWSVRGVEWWW